MVDVGDLIHEVRQGRVGGDGLRLPDHQVAHAQVAEGVAQQPVASFRCSRLEQEPAEEREPGTAPGTLHDEEEQPQSDHEIAEAAADVGHDRRGAGEVSGAQPEQRAKHAAAVEWERREEIEGEQDQVM